MSKKPKGMRGGPQQERHACTMGAQLEEQGTAQPPTSSEIVPTDRSTYENSMEKRLSDLGARIDEIGEKAEFMKDKASVKFHELNEKRQEALCKLQSLKETSADAWCEFKAGMDSAFEELTKAWEEMKAGSARAASKFENSRSE